MRAIWLVVGDVPDKRVVTGHMQKAVIRTVVYLGMTKAIASALLENDDLMTPIATFVSKYVEKESKCVKKETEFSGLRRMIR